MRYDYLMGTNNLNNLTIKDLLAFHQAEVIAAYHETYSLSALMKSVGLNSTNMSARSKLISFLEANNLQIKAYVRTIASDKNVLSKEQILERFIKSDNYVGSVLRKWVIQHDLIPYKCNTKNCMLNTSNKDKLLWNGKPIVLDLDHINGDNTDNRLVNLRFLCPNCHSQTSTYKGANNKRSPLRTCPECKGPKTKAGKTCMECYQKSVVSDVYPPLDALLVSIGEKGFEAVGRDLGLSGNSLRKHLRRNNVDPKSLSPFASGPKRLV